MKRSEHRRQLKNKAEEALAAEKPAEEIKHWWEAFEHSRPLWRRPGTLVASATATALVLSASYGVWQYRTGEAKSEARLAEAKLRDTKFELNSAKSELRATKTKLESAKNELDALIAKLESAAQELEATELELRNTRARLDSAERKLGATELELGNTRARLDSAELKLGATDLELRNAQIRLDKLEKEAIISQEYLAGIEQVRRDGAAKTIAEGDEDCDELSCVFRCSCLFPNLSVEYDECIVACPPEHLPP